MMRGTSIVVLKPVDGQPDRFGNVTTTYQRVDVSDVLVSPGATESIEAARPEGVTVDVTLQIPKTFTDSLEGCKVELSGAYAAFNPYTVIGSPMPYMDANTPTRWNREVALAAAHG